MAWLDEVPGVGKLYIGGLYGLRKQDAVKEAGITHVVSVMRWPLDEQLIKGYKHLQVEVDDVDDENLLQYFPVTNRFIGEALEAGGSVFVHCAMGKSRSATICIAYLMHKFHISPTEALKQLREGRGVCDPNDGFKEQLELYHSMHTTDDLDNDPVYQRWLYRRELDASRAIRQAPEADKIRFEDLHSTPSSTTTTTESKVELKCRKCRQTLAASQYLVPHEPRQVAASPTSPRVPASACAHYFVDALSWMRGELEAGKVEGRLECPKCKTNVGKYAWQGMQCSCGDWVVPGLSLAKSRVDVSAVGSKARDGSIRLPPPPPPPVATSPNSNSSVKRSENL